MSHRLAECCCKEPDNGPPGECSCFDSSFRPYQTFTRVYLIVETKDSVGTGSWANRCYNGWRSQTWSTLVSFNGKSKTIDEDAIHQARSGRLVGLGMDTYVEIIGADPNDRLTITWQETCSFLYEVETVQQCCTTPPDIIKTWQSPASWAILPNYKENDPCIGPFYNAPQQQNDVFHYPVQYYRPNPPWNPGCYECCCLKDSIACRNIRDNPTAYNC